MAPKKSRRSPRRSRDTRRELTMHDSDSDGDTGSSPVHKPAAAATAGAPAAAQVSARDFYPGGVSALRDREAAIRDAEHLVDASTAALESARLRPIETHLNLNHDPAVLHAYRSFVQAEMHLNVQRTAHQSEMVEAGENMRHALAEEGKF